MRLDLVHDIQAAYRKTVTAMSRPGRIVNIREQTDKLDIETGCFDSTLVLALMLLDMEQTFKIVSERQATIAKKVNQLTYAKETETDRANYIFILHDAMPEDWENAFKEAYAGDLINPQNSATIIMEVDAVNNQNNLILTGPGIEKECYVHVNTTNGWIGMRANKNSEYPLGVDLIFTDADANILCLPRTTQVRKQEVNQWAMLQ